MNMRLQLLRGLVGIALVLALVGFAVTQLHGRGAQRSMAQSLETSGAERPVMHQPELLIAIDAARCNNAAQVNAAIPPTVRAPHLQMPVLSR